MTLPAKPRFTFKAPAPAAPAASEPAPPAPDPADLQLFKEEAEALAPALLGALEAAQRQPEAEAPWEEARRRFHTLKGAALTIGLDTVGRFVSEAEAVTLEAVDDPGKRQAARAGVLRQASRRMLADLGLPVPDAAPEATPPPDAPDVAPEAAAPPPPPEPVPPATPQAAVEKALAALHHWGASPTADAKSAFNDAVDQARTLCRDHELGALAASFQQLREFAESVDVRLHELCHTVLGRALQDARAYLGERDANPHLTWNRKWGFYFSSLRIALTSELKTAGPPAATGPGTPPGTAAAAEPIDPEMLEVFIEEAGALYDPIEAAIMQWEQGHTEAEQKAALRRHFHTLKGAANSVGLRALGADFHALEDAMESMKTEQTPDQLFSFLLACLDEIRAYVQALEADPAAAWTGNWKAGIEALRSGRTAAAPEAAPDPAAVPAGEAPAAVKEAATLRVDAGQLRNLMNLIAEMIADRHRFQDNLHSLAALHRDVQGTLDRLSRRDRDVEAAAPDLVSRIQEWAQSLGALRERAREDSLTFNRQARQIQAELGDMNMGPVSTLFRRLSRAFRDACREEQKEAVWTTSGDGTQLDRTVLEHLYGPLLHVVRNAVAHGIEAPGDREAAGKPRSGTVHLSATPLASQVVLEIADDGAGINAAAVLKRGIERGLVPPDTVSLSHDEVVALLFTPGFSTKEQVSSVAGRGVGLDVVRGEIEALNGSVGVQYEPGRGTTWRIKVPLTLTASEALLVRVGADHLAIPLSYVDTCIQLKGLLPDTDGGRPHLTVKEERLPLLDLPEILDRGDGSPPTHGVIVDSGIGRAVLGVHALHSRREIVVKDLGPLLEHFNLFSGVTADSDGSLIPILQVPNLLQSVGREFGAAAGPEPLTPAPDADPARPVRVLLVDDSASVRTMQKRELTKYGFEVELAIDGRAALECLEARPFDLLITDWEMPHLDGEHLIRALRGHPQAGLRDIPVIVISSRVDEAFAHHAIELGADLCLPKPFDTHAFHQGVKASPKIEHLAREASTHPANRT